MKRILFSISVIGFAAALNSCGVNQALVANHNLNSTQVQLSSNNFKVIDKVNASSDVSYIFMIGGMNKKQLFENAYSAMINKANLYGSSRAVTNVVTEEHIWGVFPIYFTRTITVSGNVIEFTK